MNTLWMNKSLKNDFHAVNRSRVRGVVEKLLCSSVRGAAEHLLRPGITAAALPLGLAAGMALLALFPDIAGGMLLRGETGWFPAGWRLLTTHFVSSGSRQLLLNILPLTVAGTVTVLRRGKLLFSRVGGYALFWCGLAALATLPADGMFCGTLGLTATLTAFCLVSSIQRKARTLTPGNLALLTALGLALTQPLVTDGLSFAASTAVFATGLLTGTWLALPRHKCRMFLRHIAGLRRLRS